MKKNIFKALLLLLSFSALTACANYADGEGNSPYCDLKTGSDNGAYMGNKDGRNYMEVNIKTGKEGYATIFPRIAAPLEEDVTLTLVVDPDVVAHNVTASSIKAQPIATEDVFFVDSEGNEHQGEFTVTIPKGQVTTPVVVGVKGLDPLKYAFQQRWAFGVKISDASGNVPLLSEPRSVVVKYNREVRVVTSVLEVTTGGWGFNILTNEPFTEELDEWTIQMSQCYNDLWSNNISTGWILEPVAGSALYTRINQDKGIQIKSLHEREDSWTNKPLKTREWINISYVYTRVGDGGRIKVYVDDELHNDLVTTKISFGLNTTNTGWSIGNSTWRKNLLREVRIWDRALTQAEIKENMGLPMELDTEGLIMYLPGTKEYFDFATGLPKVAKGNWRVINHPNPNNVGKNHFQIIENVVVPNKKLVFDNE